MIHYGLRKLRARAARLLRLIAGRIELAVARPAADSAGSNRVPPASVADQLAALGKEIEQLRVELADVRRAKECLQSGMAELERMLGMNSRSIMWLARQTPNPVFEAGSGATIVSVIMPTWERADVIERAIASLLGQSYARWECIIVDDGSTDGTAETVKRYLVDSRFTYLRQDHGGVGSARNKALTNARGGIIAYLDTDNEWLPGYLAAVVSTFSADPDLECAYTAQIFNDIGAGFCHVRCEPFDQQRLTRENFIDLNVFAHRREVYDALGGFDEQLDRLGDWDLIQRYTCAGRTQCIPVIAGIYNHGRPDQISRTCNVGYNRYLMSSKRPKPVRPPLKVL